MVKILLELVKHLAKEYGDKYVNVDEKERFEFFREYGLKYEMEKLKTDLKISVFGFDVWYSETSLYKNGKIDEALEVLRMKGSYL